MTLSRYIRAKKVPAPRVFRVGKSSLHAWTAEQIENIRTLLPKIANGRKTRWQRQRAAAKKKKTLPKKKGSRPKD